MTRPADARWLLLIHQIPPKPTYLRVKIWRRLQRLGAAAVKNSVYVLPRSDQAREDFQWVAREILEGGGDASICEAHFVDGLSDGQVEALFRAAREEEYGRLAERVRGLLTARIPAARRSRRAAFLGVSRRFEEVRGADFFGSPGRELVAGLLSALEARLRSPARDRAQPARGGRAKAGAHGRTWVTRQGIHVDRIASAWLIRRFIDPKAAFKFVPEKTYRPQPGELRFDMFEAEYTHRGNRCTFEVLLQEFGLGEAPLRHVGGIVHDIDVKDAKYALPETVGIARLIAGVAASHKDDASRMARVAIVFDLLYEGLKRRRE